MTDVPSDPKKMLTKAIKASGAIEQLIAEIEGGNLTRAEDARTILVEMIQMSTPKQLVPFLLAIRACANVSADASRAKLSK